jgi:hypothetical protein
MEILYAFGVFMAVMVVLWLVTRVVEYGSHWLYVLRERVRGS